MTTPIDPTAPLVASGNLRRREAVSRLAQSTTTVATFIAVAVLAIVVFGVFTRGASDLGIGFLTRNVPRAEAPTGTGGIAPELVGTILLTLVATAIAMPVGVLIGLYVSEFANARIARVIRLVLDLMNGLPSIIVAVFIFGLLVDHQGQSGFAGSVGLSIIMLPLIARATQEVLALVPQTLREASDALGMSRWRTVVGVVLPTAAGGILTGTILAGARAAGETAPLLLASAVYVNHPTLNFFGEAVPNIPVMIYEISFEGNHAAFARAWGAAFVLLAIILLANVGARALLARSRAKITQ